MPPIPVLRPREVAKAFEKLGWEVSRQRGSHIILIATLSIPNHPTVARGTLRSLIARSGLTIEVFLAVLND
jgi:predicted RNA binding protein YcfA (HicA-like mRNA interferase family)